MFKQCLSESITFIHDYQLEITCKFLTKAIFSKTILLIGFYGGSTQQMSHGDFPRFTGG
jgi:hypothetical protein